MGINCKNSECTNKIMKLIGKCKQCNKEFCSKHRYPETHNCIKLLDFKLQQKQLLADKLLNESKIAEKITKI